MIQNSRRSEIRKKGFPGGGDSQCIGLEVGGRSQCGRNIFTCMWAESQERGLLHWSRSDAMVFWTRRMPVEIGPTEWIQGRSVEALLLGCM